MWRFAVMGVLAFTWSGCGPTPTTPVAPHQHASSSGTTEATTAADPVADAADTEPPATPPDSTGAAPSDGNAPAADPTETAAKQALVTKLRTGAATEQDLRMLKALCAHEGDRACRDEADSALRKLRQGD